MNRLNRFMWTRLPSHEVVIHVPDSNDETYQRVMLTLSRQYSQVTIDLTGLTVVELQAFRETVLIATDVALPIVEALDQKARDDELNGDDSDNRLYRGLPTVVVRKGALREYSEGLLLGRKDVLQAIGTQFGSGGQAPRGSMVLDNKDQEVSSTVDNPPTGSITG